MHPNGRPLCVTTHDSLPSFCVRPTRGSMLDTQYSTGEGNCSFPLVSTSPLPTLFSLGKGSGKRQWDWEHLEAWVEMGVQASPGCTRKLDSQNSSGGRPNSKRVLQPGWCPAPRKLLCLWEDILALGDILSLREYSGPVEDILILGRCPLPGRVCHP